MNTLTFFIIVWTIAAFAWQQADVKASPANKWWPYVEAVITAPVLVWSWIKIAVKFIKEKTRG